MGMWVQLSVLGSLEVTNTGGEVSTVDSRQGEVWFLGLLNVYLVNN